MQKILKVQVYNSILKDISTTKFTVKKFELEEMTVAGICRITCDVNVLLEVSEEVKIIILMITLLIWVLLT